MMRCHRVRALMTKRLHEALTPAEGAALARHLERCPGCRAELADEGPFENRLREAVAAAAAAPGPSMRVDPAEVLRRVRRQGSRPRAAAGRSLWLAGGAVAAIAVAGIIGLAVRRGPSPPAATHGGTPIARESHPSVGNPRKAPEVPAAPAPPRRVADGRPRKPGAVVPRRTPAPQVSGPANANEARPRLTDDEIYLDGRDPAMSGWEMVGDARDRQVLRWMKEHLPPFKDDFVQVPFPRLALADPNSPAFREAVKLYEKEAKVVDGRLVQKVTLQLKAASLEDLCAAVEKQTRVSLRASRAVQDEKATVFVRDVPAREVMRTVARLFGYFWVRSGEEGEYRYELNQDLRSQLAEQEMQDRDLNAALLALDAQMGAYCPDLEKPVDELKEELKHATGAEKDRLSLLVEQGGWGAAQLYRHLSPAEIGALRDGQYLTYGYRAGNRNHLPDDWKRSLLQANNFHVEQRDGQTTFTFGPPGTPVAEYPGASPTLSLSMDRSELGQVSLKAVAGVSLTEEDSDPGGRILTLATGRSPSTAKPDNSAANRALRNQPPFTREVSLKPRPSCPKWVEGAKPESPDYFGVTDPVTGVPHVTTADAWEEVHRATGMPVVADFYTHLYPVPPVTFEKKKLFDALCGLGDAMGLRWKKEGDFLVARSTAFFWEKLKEVPNRTLARWQAARAATGALPLEEVLEIASLPDQQLDSATVGKGIEHCWGIGEWSLFGMGVRHGGPWPQDRRICARLLTLLSPEQLRRAFQPEGLPFSALGEAQQREFVRRIPMVMGTTTHAAYVPASWYVWAPALPAGTRYEVYSQFPVVADRSAEGALAAARGVYAKATAAQIRQQKGMLAVWFVNAQGRVVLEAGRAPVYFIAP
jgi:hypothetical protein